MHSPFFREAYLSPGHFIAAHCFTRRDCTPGRRSCAGRCELSESAAVMASVAGNPRRISSNDDNP